MQIQLIFLDKTSMLQVIFIKNIRELYITGMGRIGFHILMLFLKYLEIYDFLFLEVPLTRFGVPK